MKWLFKWLDRNIRNSRYDEDTIYVTAKDNTIEPRIPDAPSIRFQLYHAHGGQIVEVKSYDEKTDTNNVSLHIITPDENLGEALGKIITYESLQR